MKFSELNPQISQTDISFDCSKCGPPYRVWIAARFKGTPSNGIWAWDASDLSRGFDAVTITPSINNHTHSKKPCGWHVSIVNGEVVTS